MNDLKQLHNILSQKINKNDLLYFEQLCKKYNKSDKCKIFETLINVNTIAGEL